MQCDDINWNPVVLPSPQHVTSCKTVTRSNNTGFILDFYALEITSVSHCTSTQILQHISQVSQVLNLVQLVAVLISLTKTMTINNRQQIFFMDKN